MSIPVRDVTLKLGKKEYHLKTTLNEESYGRVVSLLKESADKIGKETGQEHLLLLVSLHLAYCLDHANETFEDIIQKYSPGENSRS